MIFHIQYILHPEFFRRAQRERIAEIGALEGHGCRVVWGCPRAYRAHSTAARLPRQSDPGVSLMSAPAARITKKFLPAARRQAAVAFIDKKEWALRAFLRQNFATARRRGQ